MGWVGSALRTLGVAVLGGLVATILGVFLSNKEKEEVKADAEVRENRPTPEAAPERPARPVVRRPQAAIAEPRSVAPNAEAQARDSELLADIRSDDERALDTHSNYLIRHNLEQRDRGWAAEMERDLTSLLAPMTQRDGMESMSVDCRSETCVATSRWASKASLRAQFAGLRDDTAGSPCFVSATLPEGREDAPAEVSIFFDCEETSPPAVEVR